MLALLVAGCMSTRLFYNNLDWIVPWQVDRYFDVDDPQDALLDMRLPHHWRWHRETQLTAYVADLRALAAASAGPMTRAQVEDFQARTRAHLRALWTQVRPDVAALLATLDNDQVAELVGRIQSDWDEDREERHEGTAQERAEDRFEQVVETLERWAGDLEDAQVLQVAAWLERRPDDFELTSAYRDDWLAAFVSLLETRTDPDFGPRFESFSDDPGVPQRAAYLESRTERRAAWAELLAGMSTSLSTVQRAHFQEALESLAADFEALAAERED